MKKTTSGLMIAFIVTGMLFMSFTSMFPGEVTLSVPDDALPKTEVDSVIAPTFHAVQNEVSPAMPEQP